MTPARPGSRFWPWVQPRPAPAQPDPADLGTAFGLDLSIGEFDDAPLLLPGLPPPKEIQAPKR